MDHDHRLPFPTLRGGIRIVNPVEGRPGTLGMICTCDGVDRWILSCYHVLCRMNRALFTAGEPIYQPTVAPENLVARLVAAMADPELDVAAALLEPDRPTAAEIMGLPRLCAPQTPEVGMQVLKSGMWTGVTEGKIVSVTDKAVRIEPLGGYPDDYTISYTGDSGAIWVNRESGAPVAMNSAGADTGDPFASAIPIQAVLAALGLRPVLPTP